MIDKKLLIAKELCPRCGNEFHCSKSGKCWCFEVSISEKSRYEINSQYDTCLCPDCLKYFADKAE